MPGLRPSREVSGPDGARQPWYREAGWGGKVYEAKVDCGPGYRLYYVIRHRTIIWLLCGGAKGTQKRDIEKARHLLKELEFQDG